MTAIDRKFGELFGKVRFVQATQEYDGAEESRPRILVCEDEIFIAIAEVELLERNGYEVVGTAASCRSAVETCAQEHPDLVLLDITLRGDGDGVDAAEEIRRRFAIPFVFVTAHLNDITAVRAKSVGPAGYVAKPYDERELLTAVQEALQS